MATGNRLLICVMAVIILAGIAASFTLEWYGKTGAAQFVQLATLGIGVLCPSPLRHTPDQGQADPIDGGGDAKP